MIAKAICVPANVGIYCMPAHQGAMALNSNMELLTVPEEDVGTHLMGLEVAGGV